MAGFKGWWGLVWLRSIVYGSRGVRSRGGVVGV